MTNKCSTRLWRRRVRWVAKTIVLVPVWLLILPFRRDTVFRHYDETLDHLGRTPFSRAAYIISVLCWLLLFSAIVFEIYELRH